MASITIDISEESVAQIPDRQLTSILLQLGILKDATKNPGEDFVDAWSLLQSHIYNKHGVGFSLEVHTTDAANGYGWVERWNCSQVEYREWCRHCEIRPHDGNHSWRREWTQQHFADGFTPQSAICRSLIKAAIAPSNNGFHADRASGPDNSEHSPETRPAGEP